MCRWPVDQCRTSDCAVCVGQQCGHLLPVCQVCQLISVLHHLAMVEYADGHGALACHHKQLKVSDKPCQANERCRSWSPTFCATSRSADPGACAEATERFTIHGLWLTCNNGGWPDEAECPGSAYSAPGAELTSTLNSQWPSYGGEGVLLLCACQRTDSHDISTIQRQSPCGILN